MDVTSGLGLVIAAISLWQSHKANKRSEQVQKQAEEYSRIEDTPAFLLSNVNMSYGTSGGELDMIEPNASLMTPCESIQINDIRLVSESINLKIGLFSNIVLLRGNSLPVGQKFKGQVLKEICNEASKNRVCEFIVEIGCLTPKTRKPHQIKLRLGAFRLDNTFT